MLSKKPESAPPPVTHEPSSAFGLRTRPALAPCLLLPRAPSAREHAAPHPPTWSRRHSLHPPGLPRRPRSPAAGNIDLSVHRKCRSRCATSSSDTAAASSAAGTTCWPSYPGAPPRRSYPSRTYPQVPCPSHAYRTSSHPNCTCPTSDTPKSYVAHKYHSGFSKFHAVARVL